MIHDYVPATGAHDAALDLSDLFNVSLQGDDIQDFDTRWDQALPLASERYPQRHIDQMIRTRNFIQSPE